MSFLELSDKTIVVFGVANKRSVAFHVAQTLESQGAKVVYCVRNEARRESVQSLLHGREIHVCDVERDDEIAAVADAVKAQHNAVDGIVHSIAFANYEGFTGQFHEVRREDFLQCISISCYSLMAIANAFKGQLVDGSSVVTVSISTTRMAVESYGYMAPAKAALDSAVAFLAKSFSNDPYVRFNAVGAGLLKTSASAGIPGYIDHYMFAEQVTPRKKALTTQEVANAVAFLLSHRSSGINAQTIVADAGMDINYFDQTVVKHTIGGVWPTET